MRSYGSRLRLLAGPAVLLVLTSAAAGQELGAMDFPEGEVQHVVRAAEAPWGPCPPGLPDGCQMAVLEGDPRAAGLFTVRFRTDSEFIMPPHWHPRDERVTLLRGSAAVAFGADSSRDDATEFGPGDYYVNARHAVHWVWLDPSTELQITGVGPWKAIPVAEATPPGR